MKSLKKVPIFDKNRKVIGVLDVDSEQYGTLGETDVFYLEKIAEIVSAKI